MLDRADGRTRPESLGVPMQLPAKLGTRLQLRAGLAGLHEQLALFEDQAPTETKLPLQPNETLDKYLANLERDIVHLESLVKPYAGENIVKYLGSLEEALLVYESQSNYLSTHLGIKIKLTKPVRHFQDRFTAISKELEARKQEAFGDKSILVGKTITTYSADGREMTRKIKEIIPPLTATDGIWVKLNNNDGATDESIRLTTLKRLTQKRVNYGPSNGEEDTVKQYIISSFGSRVDTISKIETKQGKTTIYLKSNSGRVWSIHCKFVEKPQDVFGTPAVLIEKVSNWQKFIPDPLLDAYQNQRVTTAQIGGILGFMDKNEPIAPKTFGEKVMNITDGILDTSARQAHRIGSWFKKKFF